MILYMVKQRYGNFFALLFLFCVSCSQGVYSVQRRYVDAAFLASSHIHTKDRTRYDPIVGEQLIVSWNFPSGVFQEGVQMILSSRLKNQVEKKEVFTPKTRWGSHVFFFPSKALKKNSSSYNDSCARLEEESLLTYKIDVISGNGALLQTVKNRLWVEKIAFQ